MRKLLFLIVIMIAATTVNAAECTYDFKATDLDSLIIEVPAIDAFYEICPTDLSSPLNKLVKNEILEIRIADGKTMTYLTATVEDGFIVSLTAQASEKETMSATTTAQAVNEILASDSMYDALVEKVNNKEIDLKGETGLKKVKFGLAKLFMKWFM